VLGGESNGGAAIGGAGDYLEPGLALEERMQAFGDYGVIVGEKNTDRFHGASLTTLSAVDYRASGCRPHGAGCLRARHSVRPAWSGHG